MNWVAWKMLTGDRVKYLGIVFGVAFGSLLIAHQTSIFCSLMLRTASQILDITEPDLWVMDEKLQCADEIRPLPVSDLYRVRGVPGVEWAVKFYKGQVRTRVIGGVYRTTVLLGLDDDSLVGAPRKMVLGQLSDLRRPDALLVDSAGYTYLFPGEPYQLGKIVEINDRRGVIVGICEASPPFTTFPVMYALYGTATQYAPPERNQMSFILAKVQNGASQQDVCHKIAQQTGLKAMPRRSFMWLTIFYYLRTTGIPINFGITVALGFIVGTAIAGQTFYLFTIENLKQFGSLKAMGVTNLRLTGMILFQAAIVGLLGFGLGMGMSAAFFETTKDISHLKGFFMPVPVFIGTGICVLFIVGLASLLSIRKVLVLEPAVVFK